MSHDPTVLDLARDADRIVIRRGTRTRDTVADHLSGDELGILAVAGALVGTLIAFAIDAHGALDALRSIVGL